LLAKLLMRVLTVEIPGVLLEDPLQMPVPEDDQVVQAFAPNAAKEALGTVTLTYEVEVAKG
jgi:hypothetical protein